MCLRFKASPVQHKVCLRVHFLWSCQAVCWDIREVSTLSILLFYLAIRGVCQVSQGEVQKLSACMEWGNVFLKKYLAQLTHFRIRREKLVFRVPGYLS